jgi:signal transduction histidine kinase
MRYGFLQDMIEFVLRKHGGTMLPADILQELYALGLLERRSDIDEGNVLFTAKAEPERFVVDAQDRVALAPAQFDNLVKHFRARIWQMMEVMRGGVEQNVGYLAAVLIHALYVRAEDIIPAIWPSGPQKEHGLIRTIEALAERYPEPMKRVLSGLQHMPHQRWVDIDQWLAFADVVKPAPLDAVLLMRELSRSRQDRTELLPVEVSWLMGALLPDRADACILDLSIDAGVLPIALFRSSNAYVEVTGAYRSEASRMFVEFEMAMLQQTAQVRSFDPLAIIQEYDHVLSAGPWGTIRSPFMPSVIGEVDAPTAYLQVTLDRLKDDGFAVALVPASFLFKRSKDGREFREDLVRDDLIEAVIQIPAGTFKPMASVESAIVVLNKAKAAERRKQVFMVRLHSDMIDPATSENLMLEAIALLEDWKQVSDRSHIVSTDVLRHDQYNLLPSRHIGRVTALEMQREDVDGVMVTIRQLVIDEHFERVPAKRSERLNLEDDPPAFVRVRDLAKDPAFPYLRLEASDEVKGDVRIVGRDAVLVSRQFANPLPTIYQSKGGRIAIASNVLAIRPDTSRVLPEYLVHEMRQPYYLQQIKAISFGSSIPAFNQEALLSTTIRLRPLDDQRKLIEEKSDTKRLGERFERLDPQDEEALHWALADLLRGYGLRMDQPLLDKVILKVTDHVSRSTEARVRAELASNLGNLAHNFNNKHRVVAGNVRRLRSYLEGKIKDGGPISPEDPVRKPLKGETIPPSLLGEVLDGLQQSLDNMTGHIEEEMNILSDETAEIDVVDVIASIRKVAKGFRGQEGVHIDPLLGHPPLFAQADERRLQDSLQNLIDNAIKHGGRKGHVLNIEFQVFEGSGVVQVLVGNDGPASELDFEHMVKKGGRSSRSKGSGVGLYAVKRWIDEMGGNLFDAMGYRKSFHGPINFAVGIELKKVGE